MKNDNSKYEDILYSYPRSAPGHPPMSNHDRAAQFAPFAALTGFGAVITESGRLTEEWIEPDESVLEALDRELQDILREDPEARLELVWFMPDNRKEGGSYVRTEGRIKKTDSFKKTITVADEDLTETVIPFGRIISIERIVDLTD